MREKGEVGGGCEKVRVVKLGMEGFYNERDGVKSVSYGLCVG